MSKTIGKNINVAVVGGAGYVAGELLRILLNHPSVQITAIQSESNAGNAVSSVHTDLIGETDLRFSKEVDREADCIFLCGGHGSGTTFMQQTEISDKTVVIDLGNDFRLYSSEHNFMYGLPEVYRSAISKVREERKHIANPGCFATCIQLGLLPLAKAGILEKEIHTNAITGSTGAGRAYSETSHFTWRQNNAQIYKPFTHQHNAEILQTLNELQGGSSNSLYFLPMRGSFTRGILATSYTKCSLTQSEAIELYKNYYSEHPFVHVVEQSPAVKQVVNTNKALVHIQKHEDIVLITSVIDNLLKGASGQAVQNMNLAFNLPETTGLQLKSVAW